MQGPHNRGTTENQSNRQTLESEIYQCFDLEDCQSRQVDPNSRQVNSQANRLAAKLASLGPRRRPLRRKKRRTCLEETRL